MLLAPRIAALAMYLDMVDFPPYTDSRFTPAML
jgi:hypothetical protein